ncbi:MAG: cyclic nucleotide-binding domain-containing protein [Candidatus Methylumidiphilus sp.]
MHIQLLRTLIPINSLTPESFDELVANTVIETLPPRTRLFAQGGDDRESIYLLWGEVSLSADGAPSHTVVSGTRAARYALAQLRPRQFTGVAKTEVTIARLDSQLLDRLLTWEQTAGYEVAEIDGELDTGWMMRLLRQDAFRNLPPANVSALQARFSPMPVKAGQTIIRQGDPGDYYYLIKEGRADILRKSEKLRKEVVFDHAKEGDGFGEDALLSGAPRNATVVMATDGLLMRLKKKDFDELLREPLVKWLDLGEVHALARAGACLIDVRLEDEYRNGSIKGSVNLPLYLLRLKSAGLDRTRQYIAFCQSGNRSCVAAFLLSQQGFDVSVLRGGLDGLARIKRKAGQAASESGEGGAKA